MPTEEAAFLQNSSFDCSSINYCTAGGSSTLFVVTSASSIMVSDSIFTSSSHMLQAI